MKSASLKSKRAIGAPSNFRHLAHIGFDPNTGFDIKNIPPEWKSLFDKAGITKEQLENKDTAKFIVDFVQSKGGPAPEKQPAPSTSSSPSKTNRGPPPPPPSRRKPSSAIIEETTKPEPPALPRPRQTSQAVFPLYSLKYL